MASPAGRERHWREEAAPMALRFLLDTNIVSEPYKPAPSASVLARLRKHNGEIAIASITWFELTSGVESMPAGKKRAARLDMLADIRRAAPILAYDDPAATWHGTEHARLSRKGRSVGYADGQIAAVAWANALTLVTANMKHFRPFEGLRIENWFRA